MPSSVSPTALPAVSLSSAFEYWTDAWQRSILFWDVMRERGNGYLEHKQSGKPPVLVFDYEIIVDARTLDRPTNYALALITRPADCAPTDPTQRPFVVIDPRAGHGPGIGGFKMDSEIGIALKQGHPCYFVMFFPQPMPGQTIERVTQTEKVFLDKVNELHPNASGKPFVIGNCQGGWALMMLAAQAPDSVGPILLAGSPISYWAGVEGKNPMRYAGGLLGGSWATSFAGDLGNGKFDGAYLVNNFEKLNPANTYWKKPYGLYAEVDTQREHFLEFERWWGGHYMLNKEEMDWISQNLFVGNRLTAGEIVNDEDKVRVDLRNIRSPIIVFASWGDNITPPQQALNWIPDLYKSAQEIRENEQTIVYCLHDTVGHLGIFVSSAVANREHTEIACALDLIDVLPPGLYQAIITDTYPDMPGLQYTDNRYVIRFEQREVSDILALGDGREGEHAFEVVRHVSRINQTIYDKFVSPFVKMFSNEHSAALVRNLNSARLERLVFSDSNPVLKAMRPVAEAVRSSRKPVAPDNPWMKVEKQASTSIGNALDGYRDARDAHSEKLFKALYESPLFASIVGFKSDGVSHAMYRANNHAQEELRVKRAKREDWFNQGSPETAFLRLLIYVAIGTGVVDERPFNGIKRLMQEIGFDKTVSLAQLKEIIKRQTFLVRMDEERALTSLPVLLPELHQRHRALEMARKLLALGGPISAEKEGRLARVAQVLDLGVHSALVELTEQTAEASKVSVADVKPKRSTVRRKSVASSDARGTPAAVKASRKRA